MTFLSSLELAASCPLKKDIQAEGDSVPMTVLLFTESISVMEVHKSHSVTAERVQGAMQPLTLIDWLITHFQVGCHWSYSSDTFLVASCGSSKFSLRPRPPAATFPYLEVCP